MKLIHYSVEPLAAVHSIPLDAQSAHRNGLHKPRGLWVSVGDDWKEWCEGERFGLDRLAHATEIVLRPDANVLRLASAYEIDLFHADYSVVVHRFSGSLGTLSAIEWPKVAAKYQGIIIAPYVYARRLDGAASHWYYGWDCASGCLWDADAVADLRPIVQAEAA